MRRVIIGAQAAAYPIVLLVHISAGASRAQTSLSGKPCNGTGRAFTAPAFVACGVILALVVDGLAQLSADTQSRCPWIRFFHDATSAYMMAAFGMTLAPLLEEMFFRGLLLPAAATIVRSPGGSAADGARVCRHSWRAAGLCLGAGAEYLRGRRGLYRGSRGGRIRWRRRS